MIPAIIPTLSMRLVKEMEFDDETGVGVRVGDGVSEGRMI